MHNLPKLSELDTSSATSIPQSILTSDEMEIKRVSDNYSLQMDSKRREINLKIGELEKKLTKHSLKEGMLDKIISQTYIEMEELGPNEFTRRGQKQTILIKQLEALSVLQDTLMKYEDMIQKYHKIIMDIENYKLNGYIKVQNLKKDEEKADEGIGAVLIELQGILKNGGSSGTSPMLDEVINELADEDY